MILCGTDLSPVSEPVIKAAAAVARKQARELLLVTVLEREDASSLTLADRPIPFGYSQLSHGGTLHLVHAACDTPKEGHEALKAELQTRIPRDAAATSRPRFTSSPRDPPGWRSGSMQAVSAQI